MPTDHATLLHALLLALALAVFVVFAVLVRRRRWIRVPRFELIGTELLLGLLCSAAALVVFVDIATGVLHPGRMARIDARAHDVFYGAGSPAVVAFFHTVTWLGSVLFILPAAAVVAAALAARRSWVWCAVWTGAIAGQFALDLELKHLFHRARPLVHYVDASGWSFPSGHSMGSVVFYGLGAFLLTQRFRRPGQRVAIVASAVTVVLLVGLSRLFLGVHWFFDVVGGFCAGIIWLGACVTVLEVLRRRSGASPGRAPQDLGAPA